MSFKRADALRLILLYVLAYLTVIALTIVVLRSFPVIALEDLPPALQIGLSFLVLLAQRHTISAAVAGGLGPWRWWGAVAFGAVLVVLVVGVVMGILLLFTLPGAPLAEWWASPQANRDIGDALQGLDFPLFEPAAWPAHAYLIAASFFMGLLINWPIGNLIASRSGHGATAYIVLAALLGTTDWLIFETAVRYGPPALSGQPDWAPYAGAAALAIVVAIINASLVSLVLFAMSDAASGTTALEGNAATASKQPDAAATDESTSASVAAPFGVDPAEPATRRADNADDNTAP